MRRLLPFLALLLPYACAAHEVHATLRSETVAVVTLSYADGKPFAYEQFEVVPEGTDIPSQVGRTDARGQAAVLAVPGKALVFTATSRDGHGARLSIAAAASAAAPDAGTASAPRWLLVAAGGGILFGLFGLMQLFLTRQRKPSP